MSSSALNNLNKIEAPPVPRWVHCIDSTGYEGRLMMSGELTV
jgi:hypothetical protein